MAAMAMQRHSKVAVVQRLKVHLQPRGGTKWVLHWQLPGDGNSHGRLICAANTVYRRCCMLVSCAYLACGEATPSQHPSGFR